jgi:hypothetical protein
MTGHIPDFTVIFMEMLAKFHLEYWACEIKLKQHIPADGSIVAYPLLLTALQLLRAG